MKKLLLIFAAIAMFLFSSCSSRNTFCVPVTNDVTYIISYTGTELSASEQLKVQNKITDMAEQDLLIQEILDNLNKFFSNELERSSSSVQSLVKSEKVNGQQSCTAALIKINKMLFLLLLIAFAIRASIELFKPFT